MSRPKCSSKTRSQRRAESRSSSASLCETAYKQRVPLFAEGFYRTPDIHFNFKTSRGRPFHYYAYGAAVSEVEVDGFTGQFRLIRTDILHDAGASISPIVDRGQIEGGFLQGVGWLTIEELLWDAKGRVSTGGASTYKLPSWSEVPEVFNVEMLERATQPDVVMGSKAVGEPPLMLAFSVREALRDAISAFGEGRPFTFDSPATPERVFFAVRQVRRPRAQVMQLFRAAIFHTPENPFQLDAGDRGALVCHQDGGLLVRDGRVAACGDYAADSRCQSRRRTPSDWRGGFIVPGFVDAHVHFPQVRIIGAMGRTLLDWLEAVALPEEARMADRGYAAETARLFLRALASHGTTTALVFGAHFADATGELFEAAAASGLRIVSGLVLSDRLLRPDLHVTPRARPSRKHAADRAVSQARPPVVRRDAAIRVLDHRIDARGLPAADVGASATCACRRTSTRTPAEIARAGAAVSMGADYLAIYERYQLERPRDR